MKKIVLPVLICCLLIAFATYSYAADGYTFGLEYEGTIKVNEAKNAKVQLIGTNGPTYTNVRIKVDIQGPSTPKLLATDSAGNEYDIAQLGYWGPDAGFAVQGTFTNVTPVTATFDKAGEYTITLSLIDVSANTNNAIITSRAIRLRSSLTASPTVTQIVTVTKEMKVTKEARAISQTTDKYH